MDIGFPGGALRSRGCPRAICTRYCRASGSRHRQAAIRLCQSALSAWRKSRSIGECGATVRTCGGQPSSHTVVNSNSLVDLRPRDCWKVGIAMLRRGGQPAFRSRHRCRAAMSADQRGSGRDLRPAECRKGARGLGRIGFGAQGEEARPLARAGRFSWRGSFTVARSTSKSALARLRHAGMVAKATMASGQLRAATIRAGAPRSATGVERSGRSAGGEAQMSLPGRRHRLSGQLPAHPCFVPGAKIGPACAA